jgi:hypothetical protein
MTTAKARATAALTAMAFRDARPVPPQRAGDAQAEAAHAEAAAERLRLG